MLNYKAPLRDLRFAYYELFDGAGLARLPGFEEATEELIMDVVAEMANFCDGVLQPLNETGDKEGCTFEGGKVRTPEGLPRGLQEVSRGRLDGRGGAHEVRWPGAAACREHPAHRGDVRFESLVRHGDGAHQRRLLGARSSRHRRAQGEVHPQAGRRQLVGDDVPHRAAGRHRPRAGADEGDAGRSGSQASTAPTASPAARSSSPAATTI